MCLVSLLEVSMFKFITFTNTEFYSFISMSCCLTAESSIILKRRYKRRHIFLILYLKRNPVFLYGSLMLVWGLFYTLYLAEDILFSSTTLLIFKDSCYILFNAFLVELLSWLWVLFCFCPNYLNKIRFHYWTNHVFLGQNLPSPVVNVL